jgi:hypothetical protein
MVTVGGDLQPDCLADPLLDGPCHPRRIYKIIRTLNLIINKLVEKANQTKRKERPAGMTLESRLMIIVQEVVPPGSGDLLVHTHT